MWYRGHCFCGKYVMLGHEVKICGTEVTVSAVSMLCSES